MFEFVVSASKMATQRATAIYTCHGRMYVGGAVNWILLIKTIILKKSVRVSGGTEKKED
jgi:hypothetical protein